MKQNKHLATRLFAGLRQEGNLNLASLTRFYAIFINKNAVGFDIYRKATEKPLYQIIKNLHSIKKNEKFLIKDQSGVILKKSPELKNILEVINKRKLKLVK